VPDTRDIVQKLWNLCDVLRDDGIAYLAYHAARHEPRAHKIGRKAMKSTTRTSILTIAAAAALTFARVAWADTVVQIPIDALLNARPVSTLTNGAVVTWSPTQGVDGNGGADGFVTVAVMTKLNQMGVALPDDGTFAANAMHPAVVLHFSNAAPATSFQAHNIHGGAAQNFQFAVPQATYSNVYLFMTTSEGAAPLTITMTYSDATTSMTNFNLPDYGTGAPLPTTPPIFFNLISGMHKWTAANAQIDTAGHTITGVTLSPTAGKQLTGIQLAKAMGGQYLVFWGATGVATSPVDAGTPAVDAGGSTDATVADASGDDGGGASSGASSGTSSGAGTGATSGSSTSGSSSGSGGASGAAGTGASTGSMAGGSGASSGSAGASSGTGFGASPTSGGCACSFSPAPSSGLTIVGSLAALCGVLRRRRRA
jgi:uncharacterized membrane protein YgcG